jgi:hypothetical protein
MNPSKPKDPNGGSDLGGMAAMAASNKLTGFLDDDVITKVDFLVEAAVSDISDRIQQAQSAGGSPLTTARRRRPNFPGRRGFPTARGSP